MCPQLWQLRQLRQVGKDISNIISSLIKSRVRGVQSIAYSAPHNLAPFAFADASHFCSAGQEYYARASLGPRLQQSLVGAAALPASRWLACSAVCPRMRGAVQFFSGADIFCRGEKWSWGVSPVEGPARDDRGKYRVYEKNGKSVVVPITVIINKHTNSTPMDTCTQASTNTDTNNLPLYL